jgi:hypothetical protein
LHGVFATVVRLGDDAWKCERRRYSKWIHIPGRS